ncbi:N-acetylglucosamine kinase [Nonomuraea gerenzanensis]|uniref:N-acetylglucosamine kinase of eukaryotic type n=1 Tax=Nonomuraea gerenzanensis TaxID=93944 RepID=A0A1M4E9G1_9ACTN|nr:BadF/BadG/BcrA/BcrD ATPase family protein [Nonomuraea gerenzanensis]UBU17772.1 ATPase [Nonomuraea gerenzanensis]SBO95551.1 N-acetylglucosamine kinase of eukaryotic type [Nonomuraea gerenzanensis]
MRLVLAVDGGNSKTDVAVVSERGDVLATGRSGAFVPQRDGVAAALDVVAAALGTLPAGVPRGGFDHVSACLAGADLPVEEEALAAEFAARGLGADVVVRNDTFALLRAGASGPWGVAVVCGAGINAVGVSPTGAVARFPALGRLSGDWGGGEGLGAEALWHAVRAEDGRGAPTALAAAVAAHFGTATVEEVVLGLHFGRIDEGRLHELSPAVLAAARDGDAVARSLVERQAEEVAVLAEVCLRRLGLLETPTEVVLGGGLLTAGDPLLTSLLKELFGRRAPRARLVTAGLPPIAGAALLGLERLGAGEPALARLRARYASS